MGRRRIPTVLVGSSVLLREGIARILEGTDLRIDQSVATVEELRTELLSRHEAPLLVIECGERIDSSVSEIERFKLHHPRGRVAVLAADYGGENLISLFEAGTNVLLAKSISREIFLRALELVVLGETLLPPELLPYLRSGNTQPAETSGQIEYLDEDLRQSEMDVTPPLSARERSILLCLVEGESNKVIARRIGIAESTVKVHVKTILRKIRAQNRTQAAIWAMNNNIGGVSPGLAVLSNTRPMPEVSDQGGPGKDDCSLDEAVEPVVVADSAVTSTANGRRH
ncbi:MAG: response regulator transcription factor [Bradyrhizobiaceae bacterium]|nr:response regulator transcription factor [Hyphomicrobiales bacterium]MBV9426632.1 response regulator transcription factor [Bradyrhizobiaceae bacterium]